MLLYTQIPYKTRTHTKLVLAPMFSHAVAHIHTITIVAVFIILILILVAKHYHHIFGLVLYERKKSDFIQYSKNVDTVFVFELFNGHNHTREFIPAKISIPT